MHHVSKELTRNFSKSTPFLGCAPCFSQNAPR
nr:MAG TPA: hypothetical protein [Caudoviricetes sp.]